MAKYSTGDSGSESDGSACELCGKQSDSLREAEVAGATLLVCQQCAPHDDSSKKSSSSDEQQQESTPTSHSSDAPQTSELWDGDSSHWEKEGTDYDDDPLPYLISGYADVVTRARQENGLTQTELAEQIGATEDDILAVEQGRAARAGVGGSVIEDIEKTLSIELTEET